MVRGRFAVLKEISGLSYVSQYLNNNHTSLDSQRGMLSNDLNYLNVTYTVEIHPTWEFKSCNFQYIFLNWIFSVIREAKITKFGTCIVEGHSEGIVSQIFYVGLSFYFM